MDAIGHIQLGKKGLTENFVLTLENHFKKFRNIKISVLKSACRDKKELKEISDKILEKLGKNFSARIIGYTIAVKKLRRAVQ